MNLPLRFTCLLLILASGCQLLPKKKFDLAKYTPPNGVKIAPGLYLDETEIANIHWLEFLYFARQDSISQQDFNLLLPDSTVWNRAVFDSCFVLGEDCQVKKIMPAYDQKTDLSYLEHYFRYPGFRYYPVVGITPEQAAIYSIWRSDAVDLIVNTQKLTEKQPYRLIHTYRLPYASEFDFALNKNPIQSGNKFFVKGICKPFWVANSDRKAIKANLLGKGIWHDTTVIFPLKPFPEHVFVNRNGDFHNLIGNVAELTADMQNTWGWSFGDLVETLQYHDRNLFKGPDLKTGFRCIAQVSVVAASTYRPEKWYQKPEVKQLLEILRRKKLEAYSLKTAEDFNRQTNQYERIFKNCTLLTNPVLFNGKRLEHRKPVMFEDSIVNKPISFQILGYERRGRLEVDRKGIRLTTWYLQADSLNNFPIPNGNILESGDAIILMDKFPNEKGCQWLWIPYRLKNEVKP